MLELFFFVSDHSCDPNAVVVFKGKELIIRTIHPVEDITELRISYTNLLECTEKRQQNLKEQYYFTCQCSKCQDELTDHKKSSMICPECFGCVPFVESTCIQCIKSVNPSLLEQYSNLKTKLKSELPEEKSELENLFQQCSNIIHHNDKDYFDMLEILYEKRLEQKDYKGCLDLILIMLSHFHENSPSYDVNTALHEMKAAKLCSYLNYLDEAEIHISKAKDHLRVTHGDILPLVSKYWRKIRQDIDMGKREIKDISLQPHKGKWAKSG